MLKVNRCLAILLAGAMLACAAADELRSPISEETQKTQHFVKYMYKNDAPVPVTVKVNASGDNLKTSKSMPHVFVIPPRGTREGFTASAKDPRSYYSTPDVRVEFKVGDYRLTSSNMPLVLPWSAGEAVEVKKGEEANSWAFAIPEGSKVLAARQGVVVVTERDSVTVAHNDGSLTMYSGLEDVKVKLNQQVRADQQLATAGEAPTVFKLMVPTSGLAYRAIPAKFTVSGSKSELSEKKYTR